MRHVPVRKLQIPKLSLVPYFELECLLKMNPVMLSTISLNVNVI